MNNKQYPAFPVPTNLIQGLAGLTKLEYFTAAAMQGIMASIKIDIAHALADQIAKESVLVAKATLLQLQNEQK